jgi:hypothetical protein
MSIRLMLLTNYLKTARQLRFSTTTDEEEKDFNILGLNQRRASADCGPFIKTPRRKEVHAESAEISAAMRSESLKPELNTHLALIVLLALCETKQPASFFFHYMCGITAKSKLMVINKSAAHCSSFQ